MSRKIEGLLTAPHTPFHADGSLHPEVIDQQVANLVEYGINGVFVTGTTGEGRLLSFEERKIVAERWAAAGGDDLNIIVHVGTTCQSMTAELAAHADGLNVAGVSAMSPIFYRPKTVDDLLAFHRPIAAAAPNKPFYFYDIPSMTHVDLPTHEYVAKALDTIPNFGGVKFTRTDLYLLQNVRAVSDDFNLLFGADELLMFGMLGGANGAIGSTYNYAAPVYQRVLDALATGDTSLALKEQQDAVKLVNVLVQYDVLAAGKAIMAMLGIDCGPTRVPNTQLSVEQKREIYEALKDLDIFSGTLTCP